MPEINSRNAILRSSAERNAINTPVQGSAADIIKLSMIRIDDEFEKKSLKSKLLLQVHDELVFDVHLAELDIVKQIVLKNMENAIQIDVPLKVDIGNGDNWLVAHWKYVFKFFKSFAVLIKNCSFVAQIKCFEFKNF